MAASARNYAYLAEIKKGKEKPAPTISLETLRQYQEDIGKYLKQESKKSQ